MIRQQCTLVIDIYIYVRKHCIHDISHAKWGMSWQLCTPRNQLQFNWAFETNNTTDVRAVIYHLLDNIFGLSSALFHLKATIIMAARIPIELLLTRSGNAWVWYIFSSYSYYSLTSIFPMNIAVSASNCTSKKYSTISTPMKSFPDWLNARRFRMMSFDKMLKKLQSVEMQW